MRIAVIGASGWIGGEVTREALRRRHQVTAIGRDPSRLADLAAIPGCRIASADVRDAAGLADAIAGADAVVVAVTDRTTDDRSTVPLAAARSLAAAERAGVGRLIFCGGGGSLEVSPGMRAMDAPGFPPQFRAEAAAQAEALALFRDSATTVEWSYSSPPPHHLDRGPRRGGYRAQAGDTPVTDAAGESRISSGDLASAIVDELEQPRFVRRRFTAAYAE